MNFKGKRILITGACGTIGSEITKRLLNLGAVVCAFDNYENGLFNLQKTNTLNNKKNLIKESADLLYHLIVMWISADVKPIDIWNELQKRKGTSGFNEKNSRLR